MSKFWIRETIVLAGGRRFHSNELDIEFDVPFDNDSEPNVANITIYNLSDSSINSMQKDQTIIINSGYRDDIGSIFIGSLQKSHTRWQGTEKITELTIGDGAQEWLTSNVSQAYAEGMKASAILADLCGMFGIEPGKLDLVNDLTYPNGRVIDCMVKDAVKQIVKECDSTFKISQGKIYIMPQEQGIPSGFFLNEQTGLIGSPEVFEKEERGQTKKGYRVTMLLNHRITVDSILQIQSRTANGTFQVLKGRHRSAGDHVTEVEVME